MKLEMESKEIKDTEMGVNNKTDSQHKGDSVVNSSASTSLATTDGIQSNKVLAEEISISKLEEFLKPEDSEVCMTDVSSVQDSDHAPASTSQLNSNESCITKISSEDILSATEGQGI
ncbi:unnamed protein product [Larinioides sclopetarius]|uniref:Uncharacterized protein n=1 Tax=Larinioides sclopetarius TaxID=280406 RepID=A0AAV1YQI5_9ARAC